ncbi:MAG: hypothetical protein WBK91_06020 [Alphaproteobacteria bacterium]
MTTRTRKIAEEAIEDGITPLEVMLKAMRLYLRQGNLLEAVVIARHAAPYVYPRIAPSETTKEQWEEERRREQERNMESAMKAAEAAIKASRKHFEEIQSPEKGS